MKVGVFCDAFLPESKAVAIRVYHVANAFHLAGCDVTVHTSTRSSEKFPFRIKNNALNAPSNESGAIKRLLSECLLGAEVFLRILFCSYKLLFISSPPFVTSLMAVMAARIRGIQYVFDVRDEYPEVYFTANLVRPDSIPGKILLALEKNAYVKSLLVTTVTEGICERIRIKTGLKKEYLLRNGFDEVMFAPAEKKDAKFTIVFHGNIGKFQRPDLLIEIATLAERQGLPFLFKIIGWGNNDQSLKASSLSNLVYLGMVEYHQIPSVIAGAHVGLSFRSSDIISVNSFPVKMYEYIGVGLPMLVTPLSEAGEFVERNNLGFQFSGDSAQQILDKINHLYSNRESLSAITKNVVNMRPLFSRQQMSKQFVEEALRRLSTTA